MRENNPTRKINHRRMLFTIHFSLYAIFWVITFISTIMMHGVWSLTSSPPFFMLLWSPLMMLHLTSFLRSQQQVGTISDERIAYRDGFRDAVQMLRDQGQTDGMLERLAMDDEGELVLLNAQKRKRE